MRLSHMTLIVVAGFLVVMLAAQTTSAQDFTTVAEKADFRRTSSYDETIDFFRRLDEASPLAQMFVFGQTSQKRDLYCLVVSKDKSFTPNAAKQSGKLIMLVQNGIHSGEIEGKDASMILLREILVTKERERMLDSVILLVIPVFNADGHENNSRYTRANQYGPENAGFRTTAQRYNLNRDYMKMDAPEMRAWIKLWIAWMPDFFIDNHVTDGHDWQYLITYTMPWHPNAAPEIQSWTTNAFVPYFTERCTDLGFPPFPYAFPIRDNPNQGIGTFVDIPRFSTGYTALWNRPGLLIEMHSLKEYKPRVLGNHAAMVAVLELLNLDASSLRRAIARADSVTIAGLREPYALTFESTKDSVMCDVLNYELTMDSSAVTGGTYPRWDHTKPRTDGVYYFGKYRPRTSVVPPHAYFIPREWTDIIERLRGHGVRLDTLTSPLTAAVECYSLDSVKFARESFEGRVRVSYKTTKHDTTMTYPAGTVVVDLRQPAAKVAIQALEPDGPDSFISWGLLNTILEQKEYMEGYIADPLADSLYASDAAMRTAFDAKMKSDSSFAKSVGAKRDFFYKKSSYAEAGLNWYPVARLMGELPALAPWRE